MSSRVLKKEEKNIYYFISLPLKKIFALKFLTSIKQITKNISIEIIKHLVLV